MLVCSRIICLVNSYEDPLICLLIGLLPTMWHVLSIMVEQISQFFFELSRWKLRVVSLKCLHVYSRNIPALFLGLYICCATSITVESENCLLVGFDFIFDHLHYQSEVLKVWCKKGKCFLFLMISERMILESLTRCRSYARV